MAIQKSRRRAIQAFLIEKQTNSSEWQCCNTIFTSLTDMGRHINTDHQKDIDSREQMEVTKTKEIEEYQRKLSKLKQRRAEKGSSDPIAVNCQCVPDTSKVILFYRYVHIKDPVQFALDHEYYCSRMSGKVRIASEGINATLAGSNDDIDTYLNWITQTQPFSDLTSLQSPEPLLLTSIDSPRYRFFKPSAGCPHVFSELSIKLVDEICPLGQTSVQLTKLQEASHAHGKLSPQQFHEALSKSENIILLDTRNYYESKIGHFDGAIQPAIRKFSQFPEYVERNKDVMRGKTILTYCTGGIRCEKATAYMRQALPDETIFMLDGGIHNYMEWWKHSDNSGKDPLWQGKNYVFDARQSLALDGSVVSKCQGCGVAWDQYSKCASDRCHLLILYCKSCASDRVYCCIECQHGEQPNGLCACEQERRRKELERLQV